MPARDYSATDAPLDHSVDDSDEYSDLADDPEALEVAGRLAPEAEVPLAPVNRQISDTYSDFTDDSEALEEALRLTQEAEDSTAALPTSTADEPTTATANRRESDEYSDFAEDPESLEIVDAIMREAEKE